MPADPKPLSNERPMDLVRYARSYLFNENLISQDEYAALAQDSENGQRVARLETYDAVRDKLDWHKRNWESATALIAKIQKHVREAFGPEERWSDFDVLDQGVGLAIRERNECIASLEAGYDLLLGQLAKRDEDNARLVQANRYADDVTKRALERAEKAEAENARLREDSARLDKLERWLTEDPNRWQIALRRMESEPQFIVALRPKPGPLPKGARNCFGETLRAAIDAMPAEGGR